MSQYYLKISDLYDLLIGGSYKLFIDSIASASNLAAAKRWDGSKWVLIYDVTVDGNKFNRIKYYDGSSWVNTSLK
jgi:hypothetical protein